MTEPATATDVPFPAEGRLLGLDYGTVRVGVSVSTPEQSIASPLDNYNRRSERLDGTYFQQLVRENRIVGLVVGLPMHINGEEGQKAHEARVFGNWISQLVQRPVIFRDERFTSAVAEDMLREAGVPRAKWKQRLDKLAAQILLQVYLDELQRLRNPRMPLDDEDSAFRDDDPDITLPPEDAPVPDA